MPNFPPGVGKTAIIGISNPQPLDLTCLVELYLGSSKVAAFGEVTVIAGTRIELEALVVMPSVEGTYPVSIQTSVKKLTGFADVLIKAGLPRPSPCGDMGDVDGDGLVTNADAYLIGQYVIGSKPLTHDQLRRADVYGLGFVDATSITDAMHIGQYLAGVIPPDVTGGRDTLKVCIMTSFSCHYCGAIFTTHDALWAHNLAVHHI